MLDHNLAKHVTNNSEGGVNRRNPHFLYSLYLVDLGFVGPSFFAQYIVKIAIYTSNKAQTHQKKM